MDYKPEDELSPGELAELIGVAHSTVHVYKCRGDLPAPDRYVGRTPVWRYATILAWSQARPTLAGKGGPTPRVVLT